MPGQPLAIANTGLVTSVGLSAAAACAALRCKISNPTPTGFKDSHGEWIMGHSVPLDEPWRGLARLSQMAAMAIEECVDDIPAVELQAIPLLLCVAERERPGRLAGLDDQLLEETCALLDTKFGEGSGVVPHGRVGVAVALAQARKLIYERRLRRVLVVATDSFLVWPTLLHYQRAGRLLTEENSNGFMPGEGAGAVLVTVPQGGESLLLAGIGFGVERAHVESDQPLKADGLTDTIRSALTDAACELHDLDLRVADMSGEQYFFKEASLAISRILRARKEEFDLWHPAECIGEAGAVSAAAGIALSAAASEQGYLPGRGVLFHMANDAGQRAAIVGWGHHGG